MTTMDPDVTYQIAIDLDASDYERHAAARNLLTWLYGGGFVPAGYAGSRADLCAMLREIRDGTAPAPSRDAAPFSPRPN